MSLCKALGPQQTVKWHPPSKATSPHTGGQRCGMLPPHPRAGQGFPQVSGCGDGDGRQRDPGGERLHVHTGPHAQQETSVLSKYTWNVHRETPLRQPRRESWHHPHCAPNQNATGKKGITCTSQLLATWKLMLLNGSYVYYQANSREEAEAVLIDRILHF